MPVCTVFPCHATSVGIPTLTETNVAVAASDELSTIDLPSLPSAAKCFADIGVRSPPHTYGAGISQLTRIDCWHDEYRCQREGFVTLRSRGRGGSVGGPSSG